MRGILPEIAFLRFLEGPPPLKQPKQKNFDEKKNLKKKKLEKK